MKSDLLKALQYCNFNLMKHTILLGYRGSIVHGTYIPGKIDDKDVLGVCIPPRDYYFGLKRIKKFDYDFEQYEKFEGEWDIVIYSLHKYISLMLKNNPNVMSLLWLEDKHYIFTTTLGELLIKNREIFSSKLAYKAFSGYAYGQLHRMTGDERNLNRLKPLKERIEREIKNRCL